MKKMLIALIVLSIITGCSSKEGGTSGETGIVCELSNKEVGGVVSKIIINSKEDEILKVEEVTEVYGWQQEHKKEDIEDTYNRVKETLETLGAEFNYVVEEDRIEITMMFESKGASEEAKESMGVAQGLEKFTENLQVEGYYCKEN